MRDALTVVLFLALGAGFFATFQYMSSQRVGEGDNPGQISREDLVAAILEDPRASDLRIVAERAPEDFDEVVTELLKLPAGLSESEMRRARDEIVAIIRRRNADYLWRAPQDRLVAYLEAQREILLAFQEDQTACAGLVARGTSAVSRADASAAGNVFAAAEDHFWQALYDGRDRTVTTGKPTPEDWNTVVQAWLDDGATPEMLQAVTELDESHPDLCSAAISFLGFLIQRNTPAVRRVRAEVAARSASD